MLRQENILLRPAVLVSALGFGMLFLGCASAPQKPAAKAVEQDDKVVEASPEAPLANLEARKACEDRAREKLKRARGVSYCYEKELPGNPNLAGDVVALVEIDAAGKQTALSLGESSLDNENVQNCILKKIKRVKFAPCAEGGAIELTYPWSFKSGR